MAPRLISSGIEELLPMERTGDPRSHVSHLIGSLCVRLGHFDRDDEFLMTDDEKRTRQAKWELGSAFEEAIRFGLARRHEMDKPHRYLVPGELKRDGLIGSPDLVDLVDSAIIEIKLTWVSSRHDAESEKFWKYWVQVKAYCYMIGWRVGRVHVGHIMNYGENSGLAYRVYEDVFTEEHLAMNWRMLQTHHAELVNG